MRTLSLEFNKLERERLTRSVHGVVVVCRLCTFVTVLQFPVLLTAITTNDYVHLTWLFKTTSSLRGGWYLLKVSLFSNKEKFSGS